MSPVHLLCAVARKNVGKKEEAERFYWSETMDGKGNHHTPTLLLGVTALRNDCQSPRF